LEYADRRDHHDRDQLFVESSEIILFVGAAETMARNNGSFLLAAGQ
jgi:hypothetical protein